MDFYRPRNIQTMTTKQALLAEFKALGFPTQTYPNNTLDWLREACARARYDESTAREVLSERYEASLADVLAALRDCGIGVSLYLGHHGLIIYRNDTGEGEIWHLSSTLSGQPDATVSALYGIISGKGSE